MFDPFNDFATEGYLRNVEKEKDLRIVKKFEQSIFDANLGKALDYIFKVKKIEPIHVYHVHKILFGDVYPWAGESRETLENNSVLDKNIHVSKSGVDFLVPSRISASLGYTLNNANKKSFMSKKPGTILGELAYIHPFLDGNGRTLLVVFNELCRRADFSIDWSKANKNDYLIALTEEINNPRLNVLNDYLMKFKIKKMSISQIESNIREIRGLDGIDSLNKLKL